MVGAEVTELIQGYVVAMNLETTEEELMHTVFPHPTLSEMMKEAVLDAYGRVLNIVSDRTGPSDMPCRSSTSTPIARRASQGDPLGVAEALRGTPVGRNTVTNYRGLPAVSYHEMSDFDLQQEVCAKAGITGRIISNSFAAEVMTAVSTNRRRSTWSSTSTTGIAEIVARSPSNWGLGTLNPLDASHIAEGERCLGALGFKGLLISRAGTAASSTARMRFRSGNGRRTGRCRSSSIRRGCRSGTSSRWISSSSTSWSAGRSTPPWRWRA